MSTKIDWLYNRKACITCKRARGFIEETGCNVAEWVDANKVKYGPEQALGLLTGIDRVIALKGNKIVAFDLKKERPDNQVLLSHLMGPTGNLRAPTARIGKLLVIGFNEEGYREHVGGSLHRA